MNANVGSLRQRWKFRNVLFVGAGASVPFGLRTTDSFLEHVEPRLRNVIGERESNPFESGDSRPFDSIFGQSKEWANVAKADIETVLDYLTWHRNNLTWISKLPPWLGRFSRTAFNPLGFNEWAGALDRLLGYIEEQIVEHYADVDGKMAWEIYRPIVETMISLGESLPIFTTNYDGVFEALASVAREIQFEDAFEQTPRGADWRPERLQSFRGPSNTQNRAIVLHKLHGSTSWFKDDTTGQIRKAAVRGSAIGRPRPVIIYPTQVKANAVTDEPFVTAYWYLEQVLAEAELCVVIGFSFRDAAVNEEFRRSLAKNTRLRMLVIDPSIDDAGGLSQAGLRNTLLGLGAEESKKPRLGFVKRHIESERMDNVVSEAVQRLMSN